MIQEKHVIGRINGGVVVDHIPAGAVWRVGIVLGIDQSTGRVSVGDNYPSKKIRAKGILKVEGRVLTPRELGLVALVAPDATISVICDGEVKEKLRAIIPSELRGLVDCANQNCISNDPSERLEPWIYYDDERKIFSCHYCGTEFLREQANIRYS